MSKLPQNIILIGFMGSGKTTVAKLLGHKLRKKVIEIDDLVIKSSKRKSVNEIFDKDEEIRFRELEIKAAKRVGNKKGVVVSTGGGMIVNKINLDFLKKNGVAVYLETSFQVAHERLKDATDRPLFRDPLVARKLYEFRKPLYDYHSEYMVNTNEKTPEQIADEILVKLNEGL